MREIINQTTGVVLAGGKNTRMGTDKAMLQLDGKSLVEHVVDALSVFPATILSLQDKSSLLRNHTLPVCYDAVRNAGPMAGIYTAMDTVQTPFIFVCACDTPLVTKGSVERLLSKYDSIKKPKCIVPIVNGKPEPLFGLYSTDLSGTMRERINAGEYSLQRLLQEVQTEFVELGAGFQNEMFNVNKPEDYEKLTS